VRFSTATLGKVIAFSVVCAIFTVVLGVRLANIRLFADETTYEAEFDNAAGVIKGDSVKIAGVDVGRVESTRIENGRAVVRFSVDDSIALTDSSTAAVRWRNVLGQRFLYVFPGEGGRQLGEGDRIPIARTQAAGDVGELLNNLGPVLRAIDPAKANRFLDSVNTALVGNEATARRLLDNGSSLAADLAEMDQRLASTVDSSDEILAAFAEQNGAIDSILKDLNSVGGELQKTTGDLNMVITDFAVVQKHIKSLLAENRDEIDSTLADLNTVAGTLASSRRNLARTLCTTPVGVAGYLQTSSWGEWFNVRIVEVRLQDQQSNTIVRRAELPQQHGDSVSPSFTDCDKTYGKKGEEQPLTDIGLLDASEGIEALLDLLLSKDDDA
jgi:phospholipid/cholesterol/gamma-HCH transport system substrate-binding protein